MFKKMLKETYNIEYIDAKDTSGPLPSKIPRSKLNLSKVYKKSVPAAKEKYETQLRQYLDAERERDRGGRHNSLVAYQREKISDNSF